MENQTEQITMHTQLLLFHKHTRTQTEMKYIHEPDCMYVRVYLLSSIGMNAFIPF